jgi:hypothetical protein
MALSVQELQAPARNGKISEPSTDCLSDQPAALNAAVEAARAARPAEFAVVAMRCGIWHTSGRGGQQYINLV